MSMQPETEQVKPLLDVKQDEQFLADERDVKAALIYARPFGKAEPCKNRQEANQIADAVKGLKDAKKAAETHKLEVTKPYRLTTEAVNTEYKELLSTLDAAVTGLTNKALAFDRAEKKRIAEERKAEEDRLAKEAEEKAEAAQKAAEAANAKPQSAEAQQQAAEAHREAAEAAVATPPPRVEPKGLRGDFARLSPVTDYDHEVVDFAALPEDHKQPNEKSLKAAVKAEKAMAKAQGREFNLQLIPGVRIWPVDRGVSR
jgi:hypothetical protein